jgi:kynurenine 3-monooxygenase
MRDKVADPTFLLQKKIEANFSARHPDKWTPAYSLVTFRPDVRYSEALKRGNFQQGVMDEVMAVDNIERVWDTEQIEKMILDKIQQK